MRQLLTVGVLISLTCGVLLVAGCTKKAASAGEAIQQSQSMETVQDKVNYLMSQAEAFYNSKDFQQAVQIAQHVLSTLDKDNQSAKSLIEKAKAELQAAATKAVGDVTGKLFGK